MKRRVPVALERLDALEPHEPDLDCQALRAAIHELCETPPWEGPPRWAHGDLYARHVLIDDHRRVCGIIDWGDMHVGDPALDLSIAHSFLPPSAHEAFRAAYGPIDDATWSRARYRAIFIGATLAHYGRQIGDAAIGDAGRVALRHALS
jgi:aminoglycoside phosphotransferase (APT) family kinase protein